MRDETSRSRHRGRRVLAPIVAALAILLFAVTVPGAWSRRTVLNTDRYVELVDPLAEDPAVQSVLADRTTARVMDLVDVPSLIDEVFPERAAFLAGPIEEAVQGFVHDQVLRVFESEAFARLWTEANRFVHNRVLLVLDGEGETISTAEGKVLLNLVPLVNLALAQLEGAASGLLGRDVDVPPVASIDVPEEAISRLEAAFGRDLPDDFGQIPVYDSEELAALQDTVRLFERVVIVAVILVLLLVALALWLSPRKRRTLIQLMAGFAIVLVIERRLAIAATQEVLDRMRPETRAAGEAFTDRLLGSLFTYTGWLLAIVLVVLVVALITGPYPWAVATRRWAVDLGRGIGGTVTAERPRSPAVSWIGAHRDALMLGVAVLAGLILLFADVSLLGLLVLALVTAAVELVLLRIGTGTAARPTEAVGA
ncbi:MAG TPA: hypothetical protein VFZ75_05980 [Actinomycetota bacterium]|nr:hypothetical protein [Actinomycetota bacterium]